MSHSYLDIARQGKNHWWRYVLGIFIVEGFFIILGLIAIAVWIAFIRTINAFIYKSPIWQHSVVHIPWEYISLHIPFVLYALGTVLVIKILHKRSARTLISADGSIQAKRFWVGFGVWCALLTVTQVLLYPFSPESYQWSFDPMQWFLFLPIALVLTPIQTTAEELFFRGYLLQGLGLITRQPLVLMTITSLLFALPHFGNPEIQRGFVWVALIYWVWGVFFALLTLKDDRLELAMGVHAGNNLFSALFINSTDSVIPAPSVLLVEPGDPKITLIYQVFLCGLFYYIVFGRHKSLVAKLLATQPNRD